MARLAQGSLRRTDPEKVTQQGQAAAIKALRRAASKMPAYRDLLNRHGVDPASVRTAADSAALPTTDKHSLFAAWSIEDLQVADSGRISAVYTSAALSQPTACRLVAYLSYTEAQDLPYQRKFRYLEG
ncbi:MAG: hypothetical protein ACOCZE_10650 [Planctomycetota bacterium]